MFAFAPSSNLYYGPRWSTDYPVTPRGTYLNTISQARSAEAEYIAALARAEAAQRQLVAVRERARLLDALNNQDVGYSYPFDDSFAPSHGHYFPLDAPPAYAHDFFPRSRLHELESLAQRQLFLRQLEDQRRLALRRQSEERALEFLHHHAHISPPSKDNGLEQLLTLILDGPSERSIQPNSPQGVCRARRSCQPKQCLSEPELRSHMFRDCSNRMAGCRKRRYGESSTITEPKAPQPAAESESPNLFHPPPKVAAEPSKEKSETCPQKARNVHANEAPSQSHIPKAVPSPSSLKDQLEARLYSDPDVEIRDTIQALITSLFTSRPSTAATAAPETSNKDSTASKGKGKAKTVSFDTPAPVRTSNDVAHALDVVRNIEASFFALESDFTFPKTLDLSADALSAKSTAEDADSDSDSSSLSLDRKLAYTARNAPVRYYEHALSGLLAQLDAVESYGNEEVRVRRKEVVGRVERALEEVERIVEGRLARAEKSTESSSVTLPVDQVETTQAPVDTPTQLPFAAESNAIDSIAPSIVTTEKSEDQEVPQVDDADSATPSEDVPPILVTTPALVDSTSSEEHRITDLNDLESQEESALVTDEAAVVDSPTPLDGQGDSKLVSDNEAIGTTAPPSSPISVASAPALVPTSNDPTAAIPDLPSTHEPEKMDTFLLPAEPESEAASSPTGLEDQEAVVVDERNDEDAWSEVEA